MWTELNSRQIALWLVILATVALVTASCVRPVAQEIAAMPAQGAAQDPDDPAPPDPALVPWTADSHLHTPALASLVPTPTPTPVPASLVPTPTPDPVHWELPIERDDMLDVSPVDEPVGLGAQNTISGTAGLGSTVHVAMTQSAHLTTTQDVTATHPMSTPVAVEAEPPHVPLAPTPDGVPRSVQLPILMYHYLSTPPADADIYRTDLSVSPDLFAAHLDMMRAEGFTTISMYDLLAFITQGRELPAKSIILTFDDGYRDNYEHAFPLLQERNMVATFFVVTDFLDEERPAYLTWEMARKMLAAGMSIESHGRNHVSLKDKDVDYLVWQALGSLETMEYELGTRPRFVSYPAGEYDQTTIDVFRSASYWAGLTTIQGATHSSDNLFELHRVRVRGTTSPEELRRLLELDW